LPLVSEQFHGNLTEAGIMGLKLIFFRDSRRDFKKKSIQGQTCKMSFLIYRVNFSFWVFFGQKWASFRKLPEKFPRGHADFIFGIEPSKCETPCKRREMIKMRFPR
jgi:hypothetical protein